MRSAAVLALLATSVAAAGTTITAVGCGSTAGPMATGSPAMNGTAGGYNSTGSGSSGSGSSGSGSSGSSGSGSSGTGSGSSGSGSSGSGSGSAGTAGTATGPKPTQSIATGAGAQVVASSGLVGVFAMAAFFL